MGKSVLCRAQTVETAIDKGLKQLNKERSQVNIEIITEPKTGFFKRGQMAEVRVSLKEESASKSNEHTTSRNGQVWIKNGKIEYKPSEDGGKHPVLIFSELVTVIYKNIERKHRCELDEGIESLVISLPPDQEPKRQIDLNISNDKLKAYISARYSPGVKYKLVDCEPTLVLEIKIDQEIIPAPVFSQVEINDKVKQAGITYGLKFDNISAKAFSDDEDKILIAEGKPPITPKDGKIEYLFKQKQKSIDQESDEPIDYYELKPLLSVNTKDVLARITPKTEGEEGIDVFGNTIAIAKAKDPHLVAGEGVQLSKDGLEAYADRSGLPVLQKDVLKVLEVFELKSDADLKTGNIRFNGEVMIHGNVCEHVKIEAHTGGVQVLGMVEQASIQAERDITISRNAISSELNAGGTNTVYLKLTSYLNELQVLLNNLVHAFDIVKSHHDNLDTGAIVKNLIELKFSDIPKLISNFDSLLSGKQAKLEPDFHTLCLETKALFLDRGPLQISDIAIIKRIVSQIDYWKQIYYSGSKNIANIKVNYLHNCVVEASGIVTVTGQGAYHSRIIAGKGYDQKQGVFRGGHIIVQEGDITLKELGGPTGIETMAQIVLKGKMTIGLVHANVTVAVNNQKYRFNNKASEVKVMWRDDGLVVYTGSHKLL